MIKGKILIFFLFILLIQSACNNERTKNKYNSQKTISNNPIKRINKRKSIIDRTNQIKQWKKLECGLWKSKNGELGFKIIEGNEQGIIIDRYITELCCNGKKLNSIIDTSTFKRLGSSFYKDKNHIYNYYAMAEGGNFGIVENADLKTFEVIGDCYARDKENIFGERKMIMKNIDYKTFKTKKGIGCFAKDINGYYFWDQKIDTNNLNDSIVKKAITELDKI